MTRARATVYRTAKLEYLTVQAFAQHFGVAYMTISRLIHRGDINAIRVGNSIRIPLSEVARFARASGMGGAA